MRRYLAFSAAAHLLAVAAILLAMIVVPGLTPPPPLAPATVEVILNAPGTGDGPRESAQGEAAERAAPPQSAPPASAAIPPPPPERDEAALPAPPPSAPSPPAPLPPGPPTPPAPPSRPAPQQAEPAPAVRLGSGGMAGLTNEISGDTPVSPDPSAPNRPPSYPRDAAERGEQGAVILLVRVTPQGYAASVSIAETSGSPSLDRAAQMAVARWRFKPELDERGTPIASRMPIRINFVLN